MFKFIMLVARSGLLFDCQEKKKSGDKRRSSHATHSCLEDINSRQDQYIPDIKFHWHFIG
jgi:hypothetical protein